MQIQSWWARALGGVVVLLVATAALAADPDQILTIGRGQQIRIHDYVVPGKTTIFDFYSEYCLPCKRLSKPLETLVRGNAGLALRRVDINRPGVQGIDWRSPLAQQFGLHSVPYFIIFNQQGHIVHRGDDATELVMRWLQEKRLLRQ